MEQNATKNQLSSQYLLTKNSESVVGLMKCAHLKYYVNTVSTSREILFCIPLAHKPVLENLTFNFFISYLLSFMIGYFVERENRFDVHDCEKLLKNMNLILYKLKKLKIYRWFL